MPETMITALFTESLPDQAVRCNLCAHRCVISPGRAGVCEERVNVEGALYTRAYGRTVAEHVDPVEKKPLYHFLPGSLAYSIATPGCNFRCPWCQNWEIAHPSSPAIFHRAQPAAPAELVERARLSGCRSIAYTYTEPTIFFEYALETARLARDAGIKNIFVTNGYMTPEALESIQPYLDAANVDLKAFRKETYQRLIGARLESILDILVAMKQMGIWVEVTTLVIPGVNTDPDELKDAARFIANELGPNTPWHLSRFFPAYRMSAFPPTPIDILQEARDIGWEAGLQYIYMGNIHSPSHTRCPSCGRVAVERQDHRVGFRMRKSGTCPSCQALIPGVWN